MWRIAIPPGFVEVIDCPFTHGRPLMGGVSIGACMGPIGGRDARFPFVFEDAVEFVPKVDTLIAGKVLDKVMGIYRLNATVLPRPGGCEIMHHVHATKCGGINTEISVLFSGTAA
jgi:hypothetical protein